MYVACGHSVDGGLSAHWKFRAYPPTANTTFRFCTVNTSCWNAVELAAKAKPNSVHSKLHKHFGGPRKMLIPSMPQHKWWPTNWHESGCSMLRSQCHTLHDAGIRNAEPSQNVRLPLNSVCCVRISECSDGREDKFTIATHIQSDTEEYVVRCYIWIQLDFNGFNALADL